MNSFAEVLERQRRASGMTQKDLADKLGKTPQFISALESDSKHARSPSFETLRDLIYDLAGGPQSKQIKWREAVELAFAAIGLDYALEVPISPTDELAEQAEDAASKPGTEFWIVSDVLGEAENEIFARETAANILNNEACFTYFVPMKIEEDRWQRALRRLERADGMDREKVQRYVSIFEISKCAFPCRLRITDPQSAHPRGSYSLGGSNSREMKFYPAPSELLAPAIDTYKELLRMHKERVGADQKRMKPREPVGSPMTGFISKVFPL